MIEIIDLEDKRIEQYKNLKYTQTQHSKQKIFLVEGKTATVRLLNSDLELQSIFAIESFYIENDELLKNKNIPEDKKFTADIDILNKIVGFNLHIGIMAIAYQPDDSELANLDDKIVILNNVVDSENVGSIVRNCAAFNINSIIVDHKTSTPFLRRAVRVGMGNIINMKFIHTKSLKEDLIILKNLGYRIISAEINDYSKSILEYQFPKKTALIFGSEGNGIEQDLLDISDDIIHIPINRAVNSLNVASSTAIFLNQIQNQF